MNLEKAVIFDMDGVLVDSEPVILAAALAGLREFGVQAAPQDFAPFIGCGEVKFIGGVAEKYGVPYRAEMKDRVYQIYLQIVAEKLRLYSSVPQGLQQLRDVGYLLALASSADRIKIDANLTVAGICPELFSVLLSAEDVTRKKPDPEIYLRTAERLQLLPQQCLVVEDALNGIRSAKAAGMRCLAVCTTFTNEEVLAECPDLIAVDFSHACHLLHHLKQQQTEIG